MERKREVGSRGSMARRRHRITSLRDSADGNREVLNENKRRRVERSVDENRFNRDEDEEEGGGDVDNTDESFNNVEEEDDDRRIPRNRASPSSSSVSNHINRRNVNPARGAVRSPSTLRVTDDMVIGVPVPRKARSATTKRSHEEPSHRKFTPSPVTIGGVLDGSSPSSSSGALRNKKMKSSGIKTRLRLSNRSMKSSASIQDDIEIEVVEALFDLMKQSHSHSDLKSESSLKQERSSDVNKDGDDKSICSPVNIVGVEGKDVAKVKGAFSIQNGLITEIKADNEEVMKMGTERCSMKSESLMTKLFMAERIESNKEERMKQEKDSNEVLVDANMPMKKEFVAPKEESQPCAEPNDDNPVKLAYSKADLTLEGTEEKQEGRFEIDLMALPLPSSPEADGLTLTASNPHEEVVQDVHMKNEVVVKAEDKLVRKGQEEKKIETSYFERGSSTLPYQEKVGISGQQEGQLSSFPFPIAGTGWPNGLPHPGCIPPLPIAMPVDGSTRSMTALPALHPFSLPKPRPKRCMTHQYVAHNIRLHKLIEKSMQPAAAATLLGTKQYSIKPLILAQNVIGGNTSLGDFPRQETLGKVSGLTSGDESSGAKHNMDASNGKQLMFQQGLQQAPTSTMLHGQAVIFQLGQHHVSKAPINQSGPPRSASALGNGSLPSYSSGGALVSSSTSPAGTATVSFNHANFPSNAAPPYMAIFPNNGYPFSYSTNVGGPPPTKGGLQAPVMPFHNGSYYASPTFQIPQGQPKQSQPPVQTSKHDISTSNGSSSSLVQLQNKPQIGAHMSQNTYFPPMPMLLQQPEKQRALSSHSAGKPAEETSQKNVQSADNHAAHSQKSNNNQKFMVPIQPVNLAYMTPRTLGSNMGATNSNHSEHQQQQHQGSKGGVQLMPPQAFELSFGSTASTTSALNFSSMAQHPAVFQMLPDMGRQVYPQMTQQKNFLVSKGNISVGSMSNVEEREGILEKRPVAAGSKSGSTEPSNSTFMGAAVFDSSSRTLSFVQLPVSGSQRFASSTTLPTTGVSSNALNSQQLQQQLVHFQKQHQNMQQQQTARHQQPSVQI